jgi:hypothetical protein
MHLFDSAEVSLRESSKGRASFSVRGPSALKARTSEHSVLSEQKTYNRCVHMGNSGGGWSNSC